MPKYIKPKFVFSSNTEAASSDPGPMSFGLSLATVPSADIVSGAVQGRLTVDDVDQQLITTSTTQVQLLDGADVGGATKTVGSVGCYIYLKNHSITTGEHILVAIVSGTLINDAGNTVTGTDTTNLTARTFTLQPGEFAFFPFDYTGDIFIESATGAPKLEYWRFDK